MSRSTHQSVRLFTGVVRLRTQMVAAAAAAALLAAGSAQASLIEDNFDYGSSDETLDSNGSAGDGWAGGWEGNGSANYVAGGNLNYTATGYENTGNTSSTGGANSQGNDSSAYRKLSNPVSDGTLWLSYLVNDSTGKNFEFYLNNTDAGLGNDDRIMWNVGTVNLDVDGTESEVASGLSTDTTYLILAKIAMDSGGDDTVTVWVNPDLSGGESGLSSGTSLSGDLENASDLETGTGDGDSDGFEIIGLARGQTQVKMDAIRLSSASNGFDFVTTTVPEPTSLALLALGAVAILTRRKRRV